MSLRIRGTPNGGKHSVNRICNCRVSEIEAKYVANCLQNHGFSPSQK